MGEQMIKSMTGFGRCEVCEDNRKFTVEMKSVNHRYLDVNLKMPKKLNFFEAAIRSLLKEYIQRGKVDVYITYEDMGQGQAAVRYNRDVAAKYLEYFRQMAEEFGLENDVRLSALARMPEVFSMEEEETDEEGVWKALEKAVRGAAEGFVDTRVREGANLLQDLCGKLDEMHGHVDFIEARSPQTVSYTHLSTALLLEEIYRLTAAFPLYIVCDPLEIEWLILALTHHISWLFREKHSDNRES